MEQYHKQMLCGAVYLQASQIVFIFIFKCNQSAVTVAGHVKSRGLYLEKKKKALFDSRNVLYYTVNRYACHVGFYTKFT